eukprot:c20752_g1_i7.p1 GENE.c20752_g1_i7~~c20752_g1_i7.p1  ORF type:complete len:480 (+),score=73.92 c20752_g1_i7:159-1442(+)
MILTGMFVLLVVIVIGLIASKASTRDHARVVRLLYPPPPRIALTLNSQGTTVGVACCLIVLCDAFFHPKTRVHPNGIVICRTFVDLLLSIRIMTELGIDSANVNDCAIYSSLFHVLMMMSEMWLFCASLDIYRTLSNPFLDYTKSLRMYFGLVLVVSVPLAVALGFSSYRGRIWSLSKAWSWCWIKQTKAEQFVPNVGRVLFFHLPMTLIYIGHGWLLANAGRRLRKGLPDTQRTRILVLVNSVVFLIVSLGYWFIVLIIYWNDQLGLFTFFMASRGMSDIQVWAIVKEFPASSDDLEPGTNQALVNELLHYVTLGILTAVDNPSSQTLALPEKASRALTTAELFRSLVRGQLTDNSTTEPLLDEQSDDVSTPGSVRTDPKKSVQFDICCGGDFHRVRRVRRCKGRMISKKTKQIEMHRQSGFDHGT